MDYSKYNMNKIYNKKMMMPKSVNLTDAGIIKITKWNIIQSLYFLKISVFFILNYEIENSDLKSIICLMKLKYLITKEKINFDE